MQARRVAALVTLTAIAAVGCYRRTAAAAAPLACLPADDSRDLDLAYARKLVAATDSLGVQTRRMYRLPAVAPQEVQAVEDPATCGAAAAALARDVGRAAVRPVQVIRAGDVYLVSSPRDRVGEWRATVTFDSHFRRALAHVAG